jgi:dTDP-4-dehydrorhamnose reductase
MNIFRMKVLIAGVSGLLGRCLSDLFDTERIEYISTHNTRPFKNSQCVSYNSDDELDAFFEKEKPTVCVNCIVQRLTDVCELNWPATKKVNVDIAERLARICKKYGVHLIHISTDYVFDGYSAPYKPDSEVNPLQNYGISKLIAEKRVLASGCPAMIIRVPVLYCDAVENLEENAVTVIGKKVLNRIGTTKEDNWSVRRPVYIPDFCHFILDSVTRRRMGIYHFYNPRDVTTKYQMALLIADELGVSADHIKPENSFPSTAAARPFDTQLIDTKYDINIYTFTPLRIGIQRAFQHLIHPPIFTNPADVFLLLDLDGTLIDTEGLHFNAYKEAFANWGYTFNENDFQKLIHHGAYPPCQNLTEIRAYKNKKLQAFDGPISWISGAESFLEKVIIAGINFAIVTNTARDNVEFFKQKLPLLTKVKNWITREDTVLGKPHSQPYEEAKNRFWKEGQKIIGFENTIAGLRSLENVTRCIYHIGSTKEDVYSIDDFSKVK